MPKSTDEHGRIYLPKDVRDRFGGRYRIVELPSHVALFSLDEDPLKGIRAAVGDAFDGQEADQLKENARQRIAQEAQEDAERPTRERED